MGIRLNYFTDASGQERVRIEGANGEPIFTSEGYTRTEGSVHAVQIIAKAFKDGDVIVENGPGWEEPASDDEETGDEDEQMFDYENVTTTDEAEIQIDEGYRPSER